jgi:hypothetical protein
VDFCTLHILSLLKWAGHADDHLSQAMARGSGGCRNTFERTIPFGAQVRAENGNDQ